MGILRFLVLEALGASAYAVMTAPQVFESPERQEAMQHIRALIVTDSTSWPHHPKLASTDKADAVIKDGRFSGIRLTDRYTYGSSDLYHLLYALGKGQHLVLHVFPSAGSLSARPVSSRNAFPFEAAQLDSIAHIGCVTVNMYHELEEVEEYCTMTPQVMAEIFALAAYSRGLFDIDNARTNDGEYYERATVDIIGVNVEMAVLCMQVVRCVSVPFTNKD